MLYACLSEALQRVKRLSPTVARDSGTTPVIQGAMPAVSLWTTNPPGITANEPPMPAPQSAVALGQPAVYPAVFKPGPARVTQDRSNTQPEARPEIRTEIRPEIRHAVLIAAVAARQDRAAFAELFEFFAPRLKAYAMGSGADPA